MKKIAKNVCEAAEYCERHPEKSVTSVSEEFGVCRKTVSAHLKDYKLYTYEYNGYYYYLDEKELAPVLEYLNNPEMTFVKLNKKYGVKSNTIQRRLEVLGEKYIKRYKRKFDRTKFQKVTTEEESYWLGFFLADGYINEDRGFLKVKLGLKDREHLVKLANFMGEDEFVIKQEVGGAYTKDNLCVYIEYDSKELVANLQKYNLYSNKSGKEKPFKFEKDNLNTAYIRGMIDGDGHIEDGQIKYVGSKESCEYIKDYFSKYYIYQKEYKYIYKYGVIYCFELRNRTVNKALYNLYANSSIYLTRKYEVAIQNGRE